MNDADLLRLMVPDLSLRTMNMPTFTFAGDETGDVSFNFGKGATRYFVMAVIATREPENLGKFWQMCGKSSDCPPLTNSASIIISSTLLRQRVFQALRQADFTAGALMVDGMLLPEPLRLIRRLDFYLFCNHRIAPNYSC